MSPFTRRLLAWYRKNARTLPWRGYPDPYAVWVSEIMLQQTRVETVIPYFQRWLLRFPTIQSLAAASEHDVLNLWEGLGYYSRARNLHQAAKIVVKQYNGQLPRDPDLLRKLPGIGRYTAGAIASMAFDMDVPTLDGNIRRVFARVFDIGTPVDTAPGERKLWDLVGRHLPAGRAGDYNQALMDLGATTCLPKRPHCSVCPLCGFCKAYVMGNQDRRPVLKPKKSTPHYLVVSAVIVRNQRVLLAQRPSKGLLGGLWEFPNARVERDPAKELSKNLRSVYQLRVRRKNALGVIRHAYSHFKVTVHAFECGLVSLPKNRNLNLKWIKLADLPDFPMGKVDRQVSKLLS